MYSFWLPFWHLVDIALSVLLRCTASDYPFGILWPLYSLAFFDVQLLITPLISCGHCVVCPSSMYSFWLPLWYLVAIVLSVLRCTASDYPFGYLVAIVLSVLRCTASDYPFGILLPLCFLSFFDVQLLITPLGILWPLCCLSFDVQLLITPLVSFGHCVVCPSMYSFWLPLWYLVAIVFSVLRCTASDYPFGYLVAIVFSVLRCTASDYPFGYLVAIMLSVLLRCTAPDYPFGIFKLFLLIYRETRYNVLKYMKRETFLL
jgi:hypothetical protein